MKNFIFASSIILCILLLIVGKIYYNNKLEAIAMNAQAPAETKSVERIERVISEQVSWIDQVTSNLDIELQGKIKEAHASGEPLTLVLFGSSEGQAMETWKSLVRDELIFSYGDIFSIEVVDVGSISSAEVIETGFLDKVVGYSPDIVLIEPFILNDNGVLTIEDTLVHIGRIVESIKEVQPDVTFVFHPSNPIYMPRYYQTQIDELKQYVIDNGFIYLDHWEAWPSTNDEGLREYLEGNRANAMGQELWASYLLDYFIAE